MISIPYAPVSVNSETLEIEDISSFAVDCATERDIHYIMIVSTQMGQTKSLTYGPLGLDVDMAPKKAKLDFETTQFNSFNIQNKVQRFLFSSQAVNATLISIEEAMSIVKDSVGGLIL